MATAALNDFGSLVQGIGLPWTPDILGYTSWDQFVSDVQNHVNSYQMQEGLATGGPLDLVWIFTAFQTRPNGQFPTPDQAAQYAVSQGADSVGAAQYAQLASAWYYAQAPTLIPTSVSNPAPPVQPVTASSAGTAAGIRWAQAQNGVNSFRPPSNSLTDTSPSPRAIPNEWIVEGPTTFPDGTGYLIYIYGGVSYQGAGGPVPQVLWYQTSSFVPLQVDGNNIQIPGTGSWYIGAIVYGDKRNNEPPPGWNGAYVISQGALSGLGMASNPQPGYPDVPQVTVIPSTYTMTQNRTDNPIAIVATNDPNAGTIPPGSTSNGSNSSFSSPTGSLAGTVSAVVAGAATTPAPGAVAASSMTVVFFLLALVIVVAVVTSRRPKG